MGIAGVVVVGTARWVGWRWRVSTGSGASLPPARLSLKGPVSAPRGRPRSRFFSFTRSNSAQPRELPQKVLQCWPSLCLLPSLLRSVSFVRRAPPVAPRCVRLRHALFHLRHRHAFLLVCSCPLFCPPACPLSHATSLSTFLRPHPVGCSLRLPLTTSVAPACLLIPSARCRFVCPAVI